MGSWAVRLGGAINPHLPGYIKIGGDSRHPGGGFMEAEYAPLPIRNPDRGLQNSQRSSGVTEEMLQQRLALTG